MIDTITRQPSPPPMIDGVPWRVVRQELLGLEVFYAGHPVTEEVRIWHRTRGWVDPRVAVVPQGRDCTA